MDIKKQFGANFAQEWGKFVVDERLSEQQAENFLRYLLLLQQESKKINITTITEPQSIVSYHFRDSLRLFDLADLKKPKGIADIGTGGGFPGIPIAIKYPEIPMILIEVNHKKNRFLNAVIQELGLKQVLVVDLDWRTFLRKTEYSIDLFVARASLQPEELVRAFKPSSVYKHAQIVYWAASSWEPIAQVESFIKGEYSYKVGNKKRKLVLFALD